ncbi:MAG: response regulator [Treponemataceae bacterium]
MPKIVICEDEHIVALDIRRHLTRFGYEVLGSYASGEEAIAACSNEKPDLVLMDIHLQGDLDGIAAAGKIFDDFSIPVVLLTAYADEDTVSRAKESRPFGYIIKPFEERELRTAIEIALYRHSMDLKLRLSEERYRSLFEEAPSANFTATVDGLINDCNGAFIRLLGFSDAEAVRGTNVAERFADKKDGSLFLERIKELDSIAAEEWTLLKLDGIQKIVLATIAKAKEQSGGEMELRVFLVDISERRELESQLRQAQKMEAVGRFAGGIAHDFNNIITAIMGYCNLLAEDVGNDASLRIEVDGILTAAKKAVNLTRQLLAFSRKQSLEPRIVDANQILGELEKMSRRLVSENIALKYFLDAKNPLVFIDPGQFEQVIINLVVNAKDAMPSGGTIIVETDDVHSDGKGKMHGIPAGDWVLISVRDTGEGISPENIQRIFEPFFTTKGADKGTGLGLSTVYAIVNQSGGRIAVESTLKRGSNFLVYLPVIHGNPEPVTVSEEKHEVTIVRAGTILLVEDDDYLRGLLSRILSKVGYRVLEAANPGEAIIHAERESDYLLMTDVVMPHMNGYELANRLAESKKDLRVVFMSGYHDKRDSKTTQAYKKSIFIQKPFTQEQLMKALSSLD